MSTDVANNESNVKLTGLVSVSENANEDSLDLLDSNRAGVKHARFNIEKVTSPTGCDHPHNQSTIHDLDTIGYATHEAVPLTMFYRNDNSLPGNAPQRPTLAELHKGFDELDEQDGEDVLLPDCREREPDVIVKNSAQPTSLKFGWIKGVLVPCLLNIWGVILYLRLPWLTGQAGVIVVTAIILLSALVTTITTLSMSAICTNGEVKGGGAYFLISRSLGPEFGGSIGIIFSLANAVGVALYVIGFGETVQQLMERSDVVMIDRLNDVRIVGVIVIIFLLGITLIGLDWVIRTQVVLLMVLVLSMIDYAIGTFSGSIMGNSGDIKIQGFTSYSSKTFSDNFLPEFRGESFFSTFAIFFPAATGILAGVNISGDLKDPQSAIPKGTLTAIALSTVVYIILAWMIGASTEKDAAGVFLAAVTVSRTNSSASSSTPATNMMNLTTTPASDVISCIPECKYGLLNDYQVMERFSLAGPLVLAGIFAATLSSALASLVGSPKTFQAVCRDGIFNGLGFFGKGHGVNEEPRRAYVLTFFISTGFILIGQLDLIAPIISNFFLMSYALINYSVFAASLGKSPGWRPSFRYYNMWLSLLGCVVCVGIMFLINWWAALVTIFIVMALYKYVDYKKPEINWGSSGQAQAYIKALKFAHSLNKTDQHVKNFRPQCLVLTDAPSNQPNLMQFVSYLTKHIGLMICGQVIVKTEGMGELNSLAQEKWLRDKKIKAFVSSATAPTLRQGAQALMQCAGLGKLRPNIVVLGFKHNWQTDLQEKVDEYINIIHDSFEAKYNVTILRMPTGAVIDEDSDGEYDDERGLEGAFQSEANLRAMEEETANFLNTPDDVSGTQNGSSTVTPTLNRSGSSKRKRTPEQKGESILSMEENVKGHIDVWWMFDDGGLTMLLPYLLSRNKQWKGCSLRVLTPVAGKKLKSNQVRMASLLKKFRITFSGIVEVQGANSRPAQHNIDRFREFPWLKDELADEPLDKKTLRQIRLGELMREYSHEAKLVVITMPVPRKGVVSNFMYMGWLEVISEGLDAPIFLVRGNQTSVLTFYS